MKKQSRRFVNEENLLDVISDVERYIEQYKLSILEYEIVLTMLRDRLNKRKIDRKTHGLLSSLIPQVKKKIMEE